MSRRMVAPGRWDDEGPQHYAPSARGYGSANQVGAMVPVIVGPLVSTASDRVRSRRRTERAQRARAECGVTLARLGEPCARQPGHRDAHRSREALNNAKWAKTAPVRA